MRAVVRHAVHDVRTAPPALPVPAGPPSDPFVAEGRRPTVALAHVQQQIGEVMLEVAPAYLSDTGAASRLAVLCDDVLDVPGARPGHPPLRPHRRPPRPGPHRLVDPLAARRTRRRPRSRGRSCD